MTLLDEVVEAHGGAERWGEAREIRATVRSGGLLPRTRFSGRALDEYRLRVEVGRPHAIMEPFPRDGERGVFDAGQVRVDQVHGETISSRENPRSHFTGSSGLRRNLRWDALDTAYFAGYALWNYLTTPIMLTREGFEVREGEDWDEDGERWRRLEVTFPEGVDTHSREQTFYVDARGLIRRVDYTAEVVSGFARAAHYCDALQEFDGLVLPTRRRVVPRRRSGRAFSRPTIVWIELDDVRVLDHGSGN
jgi:hypothetical protein